MSNISTVIYQVPSVPARTRWTMHLPARGRYVEQTPQASWWTESIGRVLRTESCGPASGEDHCEVFVARKWHHDTYPWHLRHTGSKKVNAACATSLERLAANPRTEGTR